jgi:dynein heavy chain
MRDISKVFQGLYNAQKANQDTKDHLIKLWGHEVLRVFHDRLVSIADQNQLKGILNE